MIIGCDFHPSMQQIAWVDTKTGECGEQRLAHRARSWESASPTAAAASTAHPADHVFVGASRPLGSWLDVPPGTRSPALPSAAKTTASPRWLQSLPLPDPSGWHKTLVAGRHARASAQATPLFRYPTTRCSVVLHAGRNLQFSSRPPSYRGFGLDTAKSTRNVARPTSL